METVNILDLPLHRCHSACQLLLQNAKQRPFRGVAKTVCGMCENSQGLVRHRLSMCYDLRSDRDFKMSTYVTTETFCFQNVMSLYSSQIIIKMHESQKNKFDNNSVILSM